MQENPVKDNNGLISALILDGQGGAQALDWPGVGKHWDDDQMVWVHLDFTHPTTDKWLHEESGLDAVTCLALTSDETRPRCVEVGDGLLINLRGVNLNPGSEPDDMVSLRIWLEHHRLITLRQRRLMAADDVREALNQSHGPANATELLLALVERLVARTGTVVNQLDETIDLLEEEVLSHKSSDLRSRIAATRRTAIGIRRYLAPQREAMFALMSARVSWLNDHARIRLREIADRVTRYIEDLDAIRDRAAVTQEELASRLAEQSNQTMYVLSLVAGIFLPLGLLTGLLGINVGGMPGMENPDAFWIVCIALVAITIIEVFLLRRKKWL